MRTDLQNQLQLELDALNKQVKQALETRTRWMDEHMKDFAEIQIGEPIYDHTKYRGIVVRHYRYHAGNPLYDTSLSISYEYKTPSGMIDNTSRQMGFWARTAEQAADSLERSAKSIRRHPTPMTEDDILTELVTELVKQLCQPEAPDDPTN